MLVAGFLATALTIAGMFAANRFLKQHRAEEAAAAAEASAPAPTAPATASPAKAR